MGCSCRADVPRGHSRAFKLSREKARARAADEVICDYGGPPMRWHFDVALRLVAFSFLTSCATDTAVVLEIQSELAVPDDLDQLRFEVLSDALVQLREVTVDLPGGWPQTFAIRAGDYSGPILVRVFGLRERSVRLRRVVPLMFTPGAQERITIELSAGCVNVECLGELDDCIAGRCVTPSSRDAGGGVRDAQVDGRVVDAGLADSGFRDASRDGRVPDAMLDGSLDATSDSTTPDARMPDSTMPDGAPRDAAGDATPMDASARDAAPDASATGGLFFSEYQEGPSGFGSNKVVEIYNAGPAFDLSRCEIRLYANGASSPTATTELTGMLATGETYVMCAATLNESVCNLNTGTINHNGDDTYELFCGGETVDLFGEIGVDPGTRWSGGTGDNVVRTNDSTLRRNCDVVRGDPTGSSPFDPSNEWQAADDPLDLSGFGNRGC